MFFKLDLSLRAGNSISTGQEWIEQQKRIHLDLEHHVRELSESWAASKFEPTHAWVAQKDRRWLGDVYHCWQIIWMIFWAL